MPLGGHHEAVSALQAVIFDLDDTLVDTAGAMLLALTALTNTVPAFSGLEPAELFARQAKIMHTLDPEVFAGRLNAQQARARRFSLLLEECGGGSAQDGSAQDGKAVALEYRRVYRASFQQTPGAGELLSELRRRGLRIGVLTNYLREVQLETLEATGLLPLVDALVTVGEAPPKPHPDSYRTICAALEVLPQQAVMVGDHWHNDVAGAVTAGLRAVWYDPAGLPAPAGVAHTAITGYLPLEAALNVIVAAII
jgi:putative hydrolase of the HAD superfamily